MIAKYMFLNFKWKKIIVIYFKSLPAFFAVELFEPEVYKQILGNIVRFL